MDISGSITEVAAACPREQRTADAAPDPALAPTKRDGQGDLCNQDEEDRAGRQIGVRVRNRLTLYDPNQQGERGWATPFWT